MIVVYKSTSISSYFSQQVQPNTWPKSTKDEKCSQLTFTTHFKLFVFLIDPLYQFSIEISVFGMTIKVYKIFKCARGNFFKKAFDYI